MADESKKRPRPKSPKKNESLATLRRLIDATTESLSSAVPGMDRSAGTFSDSVSRIGSGFASQIYGIDPETGSVALAGPTNVAKDLNPDRGPEPPKFSAPGVVSDEWKAWARSGNRRKVIPGIISDTGSIPNILGNGPEWSKHLQDLANRTHQGVNESMGLSDAQGFRQHGLESLGMMAAQVPSEGLGLLKSAAPEAKGALQVMKRYGKGLLTSPAEFFLPTVEPKVSNYLFGSLAGGALGSIGDDVPEVPKSPAIHSGYAGGGKVRAFDLARDALNSRSGRHGMFSVLDQLIEDAPFDNAPAEQWKSYLKPGREAVREDVKFPLRGEELNWTGPMFEEAMRQGNRSFTKDDILRYLRSGRPEFSSLEKHDYQKRADTRTPGGTNYREDLTTLEDPNNIGYEGTHFPENTISWSRKQEMPGNELLVDEIQSDVHQIATRKVGDKRVGYAKRGDTPLSGPELANSEAQRRFIEQEGRAPKFSDEEDSDLFENILDEVLDDSHLIGGQPPETPFRGDSWVQHELQKNFLEAARNGHDSMSVVHPETVQSRYGDNPGLGKFYENSVTPELERLAKRYGAKFDPGGQDLGGSSPVELNWGEAVKQLSDLDISPDMDDESLAHHAQMAIDLMEENGYDPDRLPPSVKLVIDNFAGNTNQGVGDPQQLRKAIAMARNQIQDQLKNMNFDQRRKSNPKIQLSPELREKIKRIGVPLYSLIGGAAATSQGGDDDQQPAQYAEGGKVGALEQAIKALNLNPKATLSARSVEATPEQAVQQAVATLPRDEQASYLGRIFSGDTDSVVQALEELHRRLFPSKQVEEIYRPQPAPSATIGSHGKMSDEEFNRRVLGITKARGGLASMFRLIRSN